MPPISVGVVGYRATQGLIHSIRDVVFVLEQKVPADLERDEHDKVAVHVLARVDGVPAGTGRILADGKIGRMAVLKEYRNCGVGGRMLDELILVARGLKLSGVYCSAQVPAIPFYERAGFIAEGPVFVEAGLEHRQMRRGLTG